jgi:Glycosyltransferase family 87
MPPPTDLAQTLSPPGLDAAPDAPVGPGAGASPSPLGAARSRRRWLVGLLLVFAVTRAIGAYVADHPAIYGANRADGTGDVNLYDYDTYVMRHEGAAPYDSVLHMEYPPGALPLMMVPRYIRAVSYRTEFIGLMLIVDAIGLWGLARLARRTGSWWGVAAWLVLVPALGPVSYTRLDLAVAVALVWAIERAHARRWGWAGACIGVGAALKLVPILLLPLLVLVAPRYKRRQVVLGASSVVGACLVPFVTVLPDLYHSVLGYHMSRGVQAESSWGAALLVAHHLVSYPVRVVPAFGAYDIQAGAAGIFKALSNLAAVGGFVVAVAAAARTRRGDVRRLSLVLLGAMALSIGLGRVFSPQYVCWLIGLGAVALTLAPAAARVPAAVLTATVVLSHLEFPFLFWDVLFFERPGALAVLVARDALTLVLGVVALAAWRRDTDADRPAPAAVG